MGQKDKVTVGKGIVLDFGGLFNGNSENPAPEPAQNRRNEGREYKHTQTEAKAVQRPVVALERQQAKDLYVDNQQKKEAQDRELEIFREYQDNKRVTSELQCEILKGVKAGENPYSLFLKAAKALSLSIHNSQFYDQVEKDLAAIYGAGLQEKAPLQMQREEVLGRLSRLREAIRREPDYQDRERIEKAIAAHEQRAHDLQERIDRNEQPEI